MSYAKLWANFLFSTEMKGEMTQSDAFYRIQL